VIARDDHRDSSKAHRECIPYTTSQSDLRLRSHQTCETPGYIRPRVRLHDNEAPDSKWFLSFDSVSTLSSVTQSQILRLSVSICPTWPTNGLQARRFDFLLDIEVKKLTRHALDYRTQRFRAFYTVRRGPVRHNRKPGFSYRHTMQNTPLGLRTTTESP
jgi:hypothetical protein